MQDVVVRWVDLEDGAERRIFSCQYLSNPPVSVIVDIIKEAKQCDGVLLKDGRLLPETHQCKPGTYFFAPRGDHLACVADAAGCARCCKVLHVASALSPMASVPSVDYSVLMTAMCSDIDLAAQEHD